jgi:hypothetical protein
MYLSPPGQYISPECVKNKKVHKHIDVAFAQNAPLPTGRIATCHRERRKT